MAKSNNEAKIKFTAETGEFNDAIKQANDELAELRAELKLNEAQMKNTGTTTEGLQEKQRLLEAQLKASQNKTEALSAKVEKAAEIYGENSSEVIKLKTQLANAQAAEEKIKSEINACNAAINKQGDELDDTKKSAGNFKNETDNCSKALNKQGDEFDDASESAEGFGAMLANVCGDVAKMTAAVAAAAVATGTALAKMSVDGAAYADSVITTSTQTGIATDKLQEYQYAAELVDVSTDTLTNSMAKQIKSMKAAQDGTKQSVEAYEKLGVQVTNADGTLRDSQTVYWEVIDALGKVENETERDALAMQILGKSAQELNPLIEAGSEKMNELGKQAHEAGYVLGEDTLNAYGALDDQLQYLNVGADAAKNALGAVLLPTLTDLATSGNDLLGEFTSGVAASGGDIEKIGDVIGAVLPKAIDLILEFLPKALDLGMTVIGAVGSAIMESLPSLLNGIVTALPSLIDTIISALPGLIPILVDGLVSMFVTLCSSFGAIVKPLIDNLPKIIISIVNAFMNNLPAIIEGLITLMLALVEATPIIIQALVDAIPTIISMMITGLLGALPQIISGLVQVVAGIVTAIPQIFGSLITGVKNVFVGLWNGLKNIFTQWGPWVSQNVIQPIANFFKNLWNGIVNGVTSAINGVKNVFSTVANFINTSVIQPVTNFFKNLWNGFTSGAKSAWEGVKSVFSKVGQFFGNVFNTVKEKILSVFSAGGKIFSGIKDGIVNTFKTVVNAIIKGINKVISIPFNGLNGILNTISGLNILGVQPFSWLTWRAPVPQIPLLAKGGIVDRPTLNIAGEAGAEAIIPIDKLQTYIMGAVERSMNALNIDALADAVADLASRPVDVYVNGRKFAHATVGDSDKVQGMRNRITERGVLLD